MHSNKNNFCQHFNICSGCTSNAYDPFPPIWRDVLKYFSSKNIFSVNFHAGSRIHWRTRAKLAVRGSSAHPLIGLFKERSHDVVEIPFCQIHRPEINRAIEKVKHLIQTYNLQPYDEKTGRGDLRYIQMVVERKTGKIQASFVLNFKHMAQEGVKKWKQLLVQMAETDSNQWHSVWINLNNQSTNTIFGPQWELIHGEKLLWESFGHISMCFQPASFAQANLDLFEKMLERIDQFIQPGSKIAEFYAGVGVIGLFLTHKAQWVWCAEINPHAEDSFRQSKEKMSNEDSHKVSFHTGAANELISILEGANVVVVDPPRKGLDAALVKAINQHSSVKEMIYVSCGWESFKRDCDDLMNSNWSLEQAEGYLFFPGSNHIEILAHFKRE